MGLRSIALIGANGRLGPSVLKALLSTKDFDISVISRASSKSVYSSTVNVITIPDDLFSQPTAKAVEKLTDALEGQDALVVTMAGSKTAEQKLLAEACVKAGVRHMIPADFGSCDSADDYTLELLPLFAGKAKLREHLQQLAAKDGSTLSWTSIVSGHFFDYGLQCGLLQFNLKERKVVILDGGDIRWSATTLETIGLAVVKILQNHDNNQIKNKVLYIHSFLVTQNEVLAALKRATGDKWHVDHADAQELIESHKDKAHEGDGESIEQIVSAHGIVAGNWEGRETFANEILGLPTESLQEAVDQVVHGQK